MIRIIRQFVIVSIGNTYLNVFISKVVRTKILKTQPEIPLATTQQILSKAWQCILIKINKTLHE